MTLKYYSNVICPDCGHVNTIKIPETVWLNWIECENCKTKIMGTENHHGWICVFCSFGDTPWLPIQSQESEWLEN